MGVPVAIAPGAVMLVLNISGDISLPHSLEIGEQARFIFNGGYPGGGTGDKKGNYAVLYISPRQLLLYLRGNVNDIAVALTFKAVPSSVAVTSLTSEGRRSLG
jgi:hypothetical protein